MFPGGGARHDVLETETSRVGTVLGAMPGRLRGVRLVGVERMLDRVFGQPRRGRPAPEPDGDWAARAHGPPVPGPGRHGADRGVQHARLLRLRLADVTVVRLRRRVRPRRPVAGGVVHAWQRSARRGREVLREVYHATKIPTKNLNRSHGSCAIFVGRFYE